MPLNARNVLGPTKNLISSKWNSLIERALNKKERKEGAKWTQESTDSSALEATVQGEGFRCIRSKQMVGIFTSVWVRSGLKQFIHYLDVSCIGSGIMGCLGNKVSIRCIQKYILCSIYANDMTMHEA